MNLPDLLDDLTNEPVITSQEVMIEDLEFERDVFRDAFIKSIVEIALKQID